MEQVFNQQEQGPHNALFVLVTRKGFEFRNLEQKLEKLEAKKSKERERYDEVDRPASKNILSIIFLLVAIGLSIFNAANLYQAIAMVLNVDPEIAVALSIILTLLGVACGELLSENMKTDPFTGKKKPNAKFFGILVITILYISSIACLSIYAAQSTGETIESSVKFHVVMSIIIPMLEVGVGFYFMKDLFISITVFFISLRIKATKRKMNSLAKQVDNHAQRYEFACGMAGVEPKPFTEAVLRARAYYASGAQSSDPDFFINQNDN